MKVTDKTGIFLIVGGIAGITGLNMYCYYNAILFEGYHYILIMVLFILSMIGVNILETLYLKEKVRLLQEELEYTQNISIELKSVAMLQQEIINCFTNEERAKIGQRYQQYLDRLEEHERKSKK